MKIDNVSNNISLNPYLQAFSISIVLQIGHLSTFLQKSSIGVQIVHPDTLLWAPYRKDKVNKYFKTRVRSNDSLLTRLCIIVYMNDNVFHKLRAVAGFVILLLYFYDRKVLCWLSAFTAPYLNLTVITIFQSALGM